MYINPDLKEAWVVQKCLEVQKKEVKYDWLLMRINCNKEYTRDFFTGWNATSKVRLIVLEVLKNKTKVWLMFFEAKLHQDVYGTRFWRL